MNSHQSRILKMKIRNTNPQPLKAIKVGILNKKGFVDQMITLEELSRVGNSQSLNMRNYGHFGEVEYEFTISDADNTASKVAHLRAQRDEERKSNVIDR